LSTRVRYLLWIISLLTVVAILVWRYLWQQEKEVQNVITQKKQIEILLTASEQLIRLWKDGDITGRWGRGLVDCQKELGDFKSSDESFLKCNPNFLQCYFSHYEYFYPASQAPISVFYKKGHSPHLVFAKRNKKSGLFYSIITRDLANDVDTPHYAVGVTLFLKETKNKMTLLLEDNCHEILLPERKYTMGPVDFENSKSAQLLWDNVGRKIFVDKNLVSNRDISEWITIGPSSFVEETTILRSKLTDWGDNLAAPASGLTRKQMAAYCQFRGKQLLEAHIFDAATFLPGEVATAKTVFRSPSPWDKRWSDSLFAQADENYTENNCPKAYTRECLTIAPYKNFATTSTSWSGIYFPVGGVLESLRNPKSSTQNLKASSFYFDVKAIWHQLGYRAYWDGEGFDDRNFTWEFLPEEFLPPESRVETQRNEDFQVGFRCMRMGINEK